MTVQAEQLTPRFPLGMNDEMYALVRAKAHDEHIPMAEVVRRAVAAYFAPLTSGAGTQDTVSPAPPVNGSAPTTPEA